MGDGKAGRNEDVQCAIHACLLQLLDLPGSHKTKYTRRTLCMSSLLPFTTFLNTSLTFFATCIITTNSMHFFHIIITSSPVHPLPSGLALPFPLKPDGHVQVKPPIVFIQVASSTQSAVPMAHSLMSEIESNNHLSMSVLYDAG